MRKKTLCIVITLTLIYLFWIFKVTPDKVLRLDQYAVTIFTTTAGIIGTMFGLTAASYAFVCGDLRSDGNENSHLKKVLEKYTADLWELFLTSLTYTLIVIFSSLIGLTFEQHITNSSLFEINMHKFYGISKYINNKYQLVSAGVFFNLLVSAFSIAVMGTMNYYIFKRQNQYSVFAGNILREIEEKYNLDLPEKECTEKSINNINSLEYQKIHNLEILVERIIKNHESIGEAFAQSQRREKLLVAVITNELKSAYNLLNENGNHNFKKNAEWEYLGESKRDDRFLQCQEHAIFEYNILDSNAKITEYPKKCSFVRVYNDMLTYRDNSLVADKDIDSKTTLNIYDKRALRYTIKKRLLFFYLRGENFSNMDLTGVSFSGADLRFSNFSNCNLTKIRLKGANCNGSDFTSCKMAGMYFYDVETGDNARIGEIQLTCMDDSKDKWDPYNGKEATCLIDATFKEADVSRAYLNAPGEIQDEADYPFDSKTNNNTFILDHGKNKFSLIGTNFDFAKMFFSFFKNIDFTKSSLQKAQLYNSGFIQVLGKSANLSHATLTNSCMAWCDFNNADFNEAYLSECILIRSNFSGAKLSNVNFSYSNIVACNFEGASCQDATFKNIIQDLNQVKEMKLKALENINLGNLIKLSFRFAILTNTDFSGAKLRDVDFSNAVGQKCVFTKSEGVNIIFDNALFISSVFNDATFDKGSFRCTVLSNSVFINCKFNNVIFYKTDFSNALFNVQEIPLFTGGKMEEVDFRNAKGITAKSFCGITLVKVDFRGTGIRKTDFDENVKINECIFKE